jgi:hypothetical protein
MKGKILSVLFCLMLVFGMLFAACDNGAFTENPSKDDNNKKVLEYGGPDKNTYNSSTEGGINGDLGLNLY